MASCPRTNPDGRSDIIFVSHFVLQIMVNFDNGTVHRSLADIKAEFKITSFERRLDRGLQYVGLTECPHCLG